MSVTNWKKIWHFRIKVFKFSAMPLLAVYPKKIERCANIFVKVTHCSIICNSEKQEYCLLWPTPGYQLNKLKRFHVVTKGDFITV